MNLLSKLFIAISVLMYTELYLSIKHSTTDKSKLGKIIPYSVLILSILCGLVIVLFRPLSCGALKNLMYGSLTIFIGQVVFIILMGINITIDDVKQVIKYTHNANNN